MSAIAGLRGTGNWGTDERPKNFREMIMFRDPKGMAPLFAMLSKVASRSVDDPEYSWWDEPNDIIRLIVNKSGGYSTSDTVITVDSADPTASTPDAVYGTATHLKQGDLLLVEPSTDNATFNHELIEVLQVLSDTSFIAKRGAGGTTAASIPDDAALTLIGSVYAEGTGAPTATSRNPIKYSNYTQIFKDSYELTGTADATRARTGSAWSNDKKRKMFDHSRNIEMAMLYGRKHEGTGDNGKPKRYMAGLRAQIPSSRTTVFGSAVTPETLLDAVYKVFDYASGAGDERIGLCGNGAINALNKVVLNDGGTRINFDGEVTSYGMNFRRFVMPQGTLMLKTHPLLSRHPLYTKSMFVVDFSALKYVTLKGRDTKVKDDVQNKDEDVRRGFIQTECSLEVAHGGLTCAYLGNISEV